MLSAVRLGKFLEAQDSDLGNIPVNFFPVYTNLQLRTANDTQLPGKHRQMGPIWAESGHYAQIGPMWVPYRNFSPCGTHMGPI